MAKIQLVNVDSNNYFDKNLKVVSLFDKEYDKKTFLDILFEDSIEFDIYSNQNTKDGIMITIEGNVRYFTYAKLLDKYYFVVGLKTIFEQGKEKTELFLDYDLINNSSLTINNLKENSGNNNFFLYRTNLEGFTPTYHNLLRCSSVCENIISDVAEPNIILYSLENDWKPNASIPVKENTGRPILYIKFKSKKVPKRGDESFLYLIEQLVQKFNTKLVTKFNKKILNQIGSIINNEYTDFVIYIPNELEIYRFDSYIKYLSEIVETADFVEYIALDYVDPSFINSKSLVPVITKTPGTPSVTIGYVLNNIYLNTNIYDFCGSLRFIPRIAHWNNVYVYNHLMYAHHVPYFFSQRWTKKKIILPYWNAYDLEQVIGTDNTFVNVYGRHLKNQIHEYFDNEKICNMQSTRLCLTPNLTEQEKLYNNVLNNGLASIGSSISSSFTALGTTAGAIIGGGLGGPPGAVGGAAVGGAIGSTIGGAVGTYTRGTLSNQWKQREWGLLSIASNENYKKYLNYHIGGAPLIISPRYSIDIYESYLTDQQISIITKDRDKYGNYINDYIELDLKGKIGVYYLEGNWINFNVGTPDILLQDKLIEIFNRGIFIHFNPKPNKNWDIEFISTNNDFIIIPTKSKIRDNDELYLESGNSDIIVKPEPFTYIQDDCLFFEDAENNIETKVTEGQEHCLLPEPEEPVIPEPEEPVIPEPEEPDWLRLAKMKYLRTATLPPEFVEGIDTSTTIEKNVRFMQWWRRVKKGTASEVEKKFISDFEIWWIGQQKKQDVPVAAKLSIRRRAKKPKSIPTVPTQDHTPTKPKKDLSNIDTTELKKYCNTAIPILEEEVLKIINKQNGFEYITFNDVKITSTTSHLTWVLFIEARTESTKVMGYKKIEELYKYY